MYICMYAYMSLCAPHTFGFQERPEGVESPRIGSRETPDVSAGN